MRTLRAVLVLVLMAFSAPALGAYADAIKAAKQGDYRIFLVFHGTRCPACDQLKQTVLADTSVDKYIRAKYVYYWVDVEAEPDVARLYRSFLKGVPTCIVIDSNAVVYAKIEGAVTLERFRNWLLDIAPPESPVEHARNNFKRSVDNYVGMPGRLVVEKNRTCIVYSSPAGVPLFVVDIAEKDGKWNISGRSKCLPDLDKK